ncbi:MAG: hypothetical protein KDA96_00075 [Planctomycetaceae bacterium]|nr:hypothetical protein [Planctomycetaceae bacterium]
MSDISRLLLFSVLFVGRIATPFASAIADESRTLNVFILAGQSNMAGADSVVDGASGFAETSTDWETLFTAASLADAVSTAPYLPWGELRAHQIKDSLVHGPEVGFARSLYEAGWRNVAIIKVFANFRRDVQRWPWGEGGDLYNAWTSFVDGRLEELREQGYTIRVRGFLWHQGIDDAIHRTLATQYEHNLTNLIGKLRARYSAMSAPFVLARSVNSRIAQPTPDPDQTSPMAAVRHAQMQTAANVSRVAWINVDDLPNVNTHHFTAEGQLVIGRRFADAFLQFEAEPIPIAHRGLLRHAPENTLPAFAACLELGIGFELDIRTTKDGHLVVLHDDDVWRTTNGPSRSVREMTLHEVQQLDAGRWFDKAFTGIRIPTLEETLSLVKERKRGRTMIALNVKDVSRDGEAALVALVAKYGLLSESFAFDQDEEMSRRLRHLNPSFRIGQNVNRQSIQGRLDENLIDCFLLTFKPSAEDVRRLHSHGKLVLYNYAGEKNRDVSVWQQAADAGINGLLTDYPLECRSVWRAAARPAQLDLRNDSANSP